MQSTVDQESKRELLFDLYSHLKCNIKCTQSICEIHDSDFTTYCFQCKRSICDVCIEAFHTNHYFMKKSNVGMENIHIENMFNSLEEKIKQVPGFSQPEKIKQELKLNLNKEIQTLYEKIDIYKTLKLKEMDNTFKHTSFDAKNLLDIIKNTKNTLFDYMNKQKPFLKAQHVHDDDNFIFLLNYDLLYESIIGSKDYIDCLDEIEKYYNKSSCMEKNYLHDINLLMDNKIDEEKQKFEIINKILSDNTILTDDISRKSTINSNAVNEQSKPRTPSINIKRENGSGKRLTSVSKKNSQIMDKFNELYIKKKEEFKKLIVNMEKLNDNKFKEIVNKTELINQFIDEFKENVFVNFKKNGSMLEIEKFVKMYEEKSNKRMSYNGKSGLKFSNSKASSIKSGLTRSKATFQTAKKEDVKEFESSAEKITDRNKVTKVKSNTTKNKKIHKTQLFSLDENEEEHDYSNSEEEEEQNESNNSENSNHLEMLMEKEEINVSFERNLKMTDPKIIKREKMFKPLRKSIRRKLFCSNNEKSKKTKTESGELFKVNQKLLDLIKENQRLTSMIISKDDISLQISTIRRYFAFLLMEFIRKNFKLSNKFESHLFLQDSKKEELLNNEYIKLEEGGNKIYIYNRETLKKVAKTITFNVNIHGIRHFPVGCRYYFHTDRVYITGGKVNNQYVNYVFVYTVKDNKLTKMSPMCHTRAYHNMIFHENLKSIMVFGGEETGSCEMYDFFINMWTLIPSLNYPRANLSVYIDKLGTFAYAMCGIIGPIRDGKYSDVIEFLDLVDMNQGWAKVDYKNKAEVDLKQGENKFVVLSDEKIVFYGANESRKWHRCYCLFNMKKFEIVKLEKDQLEFMKAKYLMNPNEN